MINQEAKQQLLFHQFQKAINGLDNTDYIYVQMLLNDIANTIQINSNCIIDINEDVLNKIFELSTNENKKLASYALKVLYYIAKFTPQNINLLIEKELIQIIRKSLPIPIACRFTYMLATTSEEFFAELTKMNFHTLLLELFKIFSYHGEEPRYNNMQIASEIAVALIPFIKFMDIEDDFLEEITNSLLMWLPDEEFAYNYFIEVRKVKPIEILMHSEQIRVILGFYKEYLRHKRLIVKMMDIIATCTAEMALGLIEMNIIELINYYIKYFENVDDFITNVFELSTDLIKHSSIHARKFFNDDLCTNIYNLFQKGSITAKNEACKFVMKALELNLTDPEFDSSIEQTHLLEYFSDFLCSSDNNVVLSVLKVLINIWNIGVKSPEGRPEFITDIIDMMSEEDFLEDIESLLSGSNNLVIDYAQELLSTIKA